MSSSGASSPSAPERAMARRALEKVRRARRVGTGGMVRIQNLELSDGMAADLERFFRTRSVATGEGMTPMEASSQLQGDRHGPAQRSAIHGHGEGSQRSARSESEEERARRRRALEEMARISHEAGEGS